MPPAPVIAKSAVCHSGRLVANNATRSPGFTPNSTRAMDRPATRRRNSAEEIGSQTLERRVSWARGLGSESMAFKNREGRVPYLIEVFSLYSNVLVTAIGRKTWEQRPGLSPFTVAGALEAAAPLPCK